MRFSCMTQSMSASFYRYRLVHIMHKICTFSLTTRMHSSRMRTAHSSSHPGGCLPQCMLGYPPSVGLETPTGVGLENPSPVWAWRTQLGVGLETPLARPLNFPPGCGPGDLQGMLGYPTHPRDLPARHAGIPSPRKKNRHV